MSRFRNLTLAIISGLLVQLVTPAQQPAAPLDRNDPELRAILSEIESDIEKARIEKKIAGLSVAIVYDQDVLLSKGFGLADVDKKVPADSATVYRVGSITKVFTALMPYNHFWFSITREELSRASIKRPIRILVSPPSAVKCYRCR